MNSEPEIDLDCAFCLEGKSGCLEDSLLHAFGAPRFRRILWENSLFFCVPSLGPITFGHVMLVSRKHYDCLRDTPVDVSQDLVKAALEVRNRLQAKLGCEVLIFENGEKTGEQSKTCISHVHIHIVPMPPSVGGRKALADTSFTSYKAPTAGYLSRLPRDQDYSILIDDENSGNIYVDKSIPSQYMRKILAEMWGVPEQWNWRDNPNLGALKKMIDELSDFL